MPRQSEEHWFKKQITVGNLFIIGTMAFGFAGFYFNTSTSIQAQAQSIAKIEQKLTETEKKDEKQQTQVISERQTLRAEMTDRAEKTSTGIAELNKQTAVLSTQLVAIRDDLVRLSAQITNIPNAVPPLPPRK